MSKDATPATSPTKHLHTEDQHAINVWIVEDNALYRQTMQDLIGETPGLRCPQVFDTCEAALGVLNHSFAPEVILMDIALPGMSGIEGVRRIKSISPSTHIIMVTVHQDNDRIFEAICAGASGYLLKRAPADRILKAIREVHGGGAAMDARIARRVLNLFTQMASPRWDYNLTEREKEVLDLLVDGLTKKQIAEELVLSYHTVDTHIKNIYAKLQVHSSSEAVKKAVQERLL